MTRLRLTAALAIAIIAAGCTGSAESTEAEATTTPTTTSNTEAPETTEPDLPDGSETGPVNISGEPLAALGDFSGVADSSTDPAVGSVVPTLAGTNFNGLEVTIGPDGRAKVVYFLAHWCPHCQDEVKLIEELVADGSQPADVDIYAVAIAVNADRDNYPPSLWLENFPGTVMRDTLDNTGAVASGVSGIPYTLYLDGEHRLMARSIGSLSKDQILEQWEALSGS